MKLSVTGHKPDHYKALYEARRRAADPDIARMLMAQAYLNNEVDLPLPELNRSERPAVANLAAQGLNQLARRIASLDPTIYFASLNLGQKKADEDAENRGRVIRGWRDKNRMRIVNAKRARHGLAYASLPVVLKPHPKLNIPFWDVRHPLQTFPSDKAFQDPHPENCIFTSQVSYAWLSSNYPETASAIRKSRGSLGQPWDQLHPDLDKKFTLLEYVDANEITMIALGDRPDTDTYSYPVAMDEYMDCAILTSAVNWAGVSPAVVPGAINLDKQQGHFDSIFGMYHAQAILMAYSLIATEKAIFPTPWAVSSPGETVKVLSVPDRFSGRPGEISGGTLEFQQIDPSFRAIEIGDRLEYAARMTAGLPSEFGGMSPTNVRTGRRGSQVMGETIDFTISEMQDIITAATYTENQIAMAIDKGYWPGKKTYFIMTRSFSGRVDYDPMNLWGQTPHGDGREHIVDYPMGGIDLQNLPIEGGQRVQMGTMSRRRFMQIDPAVPDWDAEERQILIETLDAGFIQSIAAQAADPMAQAFQPQDMARLKELIRKDRGLTLEEAVMQVQKEAQQRQASQAPPGSPETMPGMATPGMGAEVPTEEGPPGVEQLPALLSQLGTVQQAQQFRSSNGSI